MPYALQKSKLVALLHKNGIDDTEKVIKNVDLNQSYKTNRNEVLQILNGDNLSTSKSETNNDKKKIEISSTSNSDDMNKKTESSNNTEKRENWQYFDVEKRHFVPKSVFGDVITVCGQAGSGKSYGSGVLLEIADKYNVPFICFDPQSANKNLSQLGNGCIVKAKIKGAVEEAKKFLKYFKNIVVVPNRLNMEQYNLYIADFLRYYIDHMPKGLVVFLFDETQQYCAKKDTPAKKQIERLTCQKRSTGRCAIFSTQKMSKIDENSRDQTSHWIIYRLDGGDIPILERLLKERGLDTKERAGIIKEVLEFESGEYIIFSKKITSQAS